MLKCNFIIYIVKIVNFCVTNQTCCFFLDFLFDTFVYLYNEFKLFSRPTHLSYVSPPPLESSFSRISLLLPCLLLVCGPLNWIRMPCISMGGRLLLEQGQLINGRIIGKKRTPSFLTTVNFPQSHMDKVSWTTSSFMMKCWHAHWYRYCAYSHRRTEFMSSAT